MQDISKKIIGGISMAQMLIHLMWIPLLLRLYHLHHLLVLHHHMDLMTSLLGCLDNTLVIPTKEQVDKMEEMMMEMVHRSRSLQMISLGPLLVMDDKGGEVMKIKASALPSVYLF